MKNKKSKAEFVKQFGPLLDSLRDLGGSGKPKEVTENIAKIFNLSDDKLEEVSKTGVPKFYNQVAWARQYLVWEGLISNDQKGTWSLTTKGFDTFLNDENSSNIFFKWVKFHSDSKKNNTDIEVIKIIENDNLDPNEITDTISPKLIEVLQTLSPKGFELICKRLLREHGFENVVVTGGSHDGGIDGYGTLEFNPFVSMKVLFQCKRYKGTVSRSQVGDFRNAMIGRAEKGIIITTGIFSEDAKREASRDGAPPIELIDGKKLVLLFESIELGVKPRTVFDVDLSFFEQFKQLTPIQAIF